jgi:hypothetical protein
MSQCSLGIFNLVTGLGILWVLNNILLFFGGVDPLNPLFYTFIIYICQPSWLKGTGSFYLLFCVLVTFFFYCALSSGPAWIWASLNGHGEM